ncbi:hypothetical protein KC19_7G095400 [Ceratodon purpureus]|uniref:Uncharacterized protein n=1 Tax=Ceratodon purpureus TaxID=3225 RepID=A0A8T0H9C9_CERPU|nr:hypothetical protein KC19_7G095400 [Ceratodon purpureus]
MGRKPCCEKVGLKRGPWTAEEDQKLVSYITHSGLGCWRAIPKLAGLLRCGKSCRLRWTNYLRPDLKRGIFTEEEENTILDLHATLGNRWSRIAAQLPGRTDNEIKNYWNTRLKKRLRSQGLDPATHLPLDSSKDEDGDDSDSPDGEDDDDSDASGTKVESRKVKKPKLKEPVKPVRQPRGPKPAPQLKMCQSDDGPVLIKVLKAPKSPTSVIINPAPASCKSDDDLHSELSSSSTVTTKSGAEDNHESSFACKLTSLPSYPEAELWKSIKPSTISSPLPPASLLDEWADSYRHVDHPLLLNPYPTQSRFEEMNCSKQVIAPSPIGTLDSAGMQQADMMHFNPQDFVGENYGGIFQETCFAQPEIGMSWSMDADMCQPAPESMFAPSPMPMNPAGMYHREMQQPAPLQQSQELQRLAAILDLI